MGWQEAKKKHETSGNVNDQATEDFVARRVLRGLGYVAKQVPLLERSLKIRDTKDETLWTRTRKILELATPDTTSSSMPWFWKHLACHLEIRKVTKHSEVVELLNDVRLQWEGHPRIGQDPVDGIYYLVLLTKYAALNEARVYFATPYDRLGRLTPPFTVVGKLEDHYGSLFVVCQEAELFIRQFGPYQEMLQGDTE